jgi:lipopolysaccharide/colanic/teichoic acid biosynthesis glycosyltransferase
MWAGISPVLAFIIRDGAINRIDAVVVYCCTALVISVIVFQWFRISSPIASFFSMHDAFTLARACVTAVALTAAVLFIFTRLDDAPRSIPIIHFLVLGCGLIGVRAWSRLSETWRKPPQSHQLRCEEFEYIIIIGATRLAWFFSKMVEELSARELRIIGIIDERPQLINRTVNGYSIVGLPKNLPTIIDEYAIHGVKITKVVVAVDPRELTDKTRLDVWTACRLRRIPIEWLHETFSVSRMQTTAPAQFVAHQDFADAVTCGPYWTVKRLIDVAAALGLALTLAPLTMCVAALVMVDVGFPIVFWQQRIGHLGQPLRVYKFRTMRSSFDPEGNSVPESQRLSMLGRLLRSSRLDEIPQLFNVLVGNMSLIGPRPLLPVDQPKNTRLRLQVRPGLTGLAQINGGTSLSPEEKDALDEWYIRHASLLLDLKIILRTIWVLVHGNPRNDTQISEALAERCMRSQRVLQ